MRGPSWGTPARPSDACRSRPGPECDRSPLTRRLSVLRTGPFSPAWWWSPHEIVPSSPAGLPPGSPGLSWEGRRGPPLLRRALHPPGYTVPSGLHAGGRDPVHAPSPTGRVPRALGDFSGQRARGVRCLQVEAGGRGPDPCPDHPSPALSAAPAAAQGQLHGGAGGGGPQAASRLPLHRPAALHEAQEAERGVSDQAAPGSAAGPGHPGGLLQKETGCSCQSACRGHPPVCQATLWMWCQAHGQRSSLADVLGQRG